MRVATHQTVTRRVVPYSQPPKTSQASPADDSTWPLSPPTSQQKLAADDPDRKTARCAERPPDTPAPTGSHVAVQNATASGSASAPVDGLTAAAHASKCLEPLLELSRAQAVDIRILQGRLAASEAAHQVTQTDLADCSDAFDMLRAESQQKLAEEAKARSNLSSLCLKEIAENRKLREELGAWKDRASRFKATMDQGYSDLVKGNASS